MPRIYRGLAKEIKTLQPLTITSPRATMTKVLLCKSGEMLCGVSGTNQVRAVRRHALDESPHATPGISFPREDGSGRETGIKKEKMLPKSRYVPTKNTRCTRLLEATEDGLSTLVNALLDVVQGGHKADPRRRLQLYVHLPDTQTPP